MSKHRIKSIAIDDDYDDDDYDDDYDGDEGISGEKSNEENGGLAPEDMERLRIGTVEVRSALGHSLSSTGDKEIQDTLWHYYYDTTKTINYLKSAGYFQGTSNVC